MLRKAGLLRPSVGELQAAEEPDIAAIEAAVVAAGTLSQLPTLELSASPEAKAQSLSQLTEDQIQKLMGDVSKLSATEKRLRRYTIIKHREHWKSQDPGRVKTASEKDPLYEKEVVGIHYGISTWRGALGRKK
jgi:hypothetical protein